MHFFHLNILKELSILAQKIYNAHVIFHQFCVKNGGKSQLPSACSPLLVNPNASELAVLRNKITTPKKNLCQKHFSFFFLKKGILKSL